VHLTNVVYSFHIALPEETQKVLGAAKHPVITTSTGDPDIWNLMLQAAQ
jgi:hypothetical protein